MTDVCDLENNIDIKENPVQVAKEMCLISSRVIFNWNSSSKSNIECFAELKKSE